MYAQVIIDITHSGLDRPFTYRIPDKLENELVLGACVLVPFGKGNTVRRAYVIGITDSCNYEEDKIKNVLEVVKGGNEAADRALALALFMKNSFGGTLNQSLKTVLPVKAKVKELEKKVIVRKAGREEILAALGEALRKKQAARVRILEALSDEDRIPYELASSKLNVAASTINSLVEKGYITIETTRNYRNVKAAEDKARKNVTLNEMQQAVVDAFDSDLEAGNKPRYLIHGITGSGKTEVYMELAQRVIEKGQQVIFLIPEISLTYQTLMRFYSRFGDRVSVLNSTMSAGEKYDQCERAERGEIDIIIGPRSALFAPFPNLGLIVMDEEHENSYKSELTPKYHARDVAQYLADISGAALVLGSATPSLEAYYKAEIGEYKCFKLTERASGGYLPSVTTVDLRDELKSGNRSIFSRRLQELMADRLSKNEQIMLFLNRRGYAGFISCRSCGEVMKCPHCEVSLSEHWGNKLTCHYCGYTIEKPKTCPKCSSPYLMPFKAGTEQVEQKLKEMYPDVKVLRMDKDTTQTKDSYEKILSSFASEEAQVLIGTQMIVKGHDFPKVTLVGILAADLSLAADDYRAGERTFQLLTQAIGRAGRGEIPGEAVLQTYQPDHYAVVHAANQDYESFYKDEIAFRKMAAYPPASHIMAVQIYGENQEAVARFSDRLKQLMVGGMLRILGPAPASLSKLKDMFRYAIYIKSADMNQLVYLKDRLEDYLTDNRPRDIYVQFDFDPMNGF